MEDEKEEEKLKKDLINKKRNRELNKNENKIINKKKKNNEPRKTKQKILNEYYNLTPIIKIENNIRFIEPYEFKYQLYIKQRWLGKKLLEVLQTEFHSYTKEYFIEAINNGKILINEKKVSEDYLLKDNDFMTHLTIRKENPIIYQKLDIIFEDNNFLVVDKPSSWPVHICGAYNFNTLQRILMDEYKYNDIKILHRLDKQTSGIVIFAKNTDSAELFRNRLHTDDVQKIYFARVKGDFSSIKNKDIVFENGRIICKRYIKPVDKSKGIHTDVDDKEVEEFLKNKEKEKENKKSKGKNEEEKFEPKYAETEFEFLFYDKNSNTSVVKCYPKTGRTHQIRIHLRFLGFPIANDPCYGGIIYNDVKELDNPNLKGYQFNLDNVDNDNNNKDIFSVSELYCYKIWLHAWSYNFDKYQFKTKEPDWVKKDYVINKQF